MINQLIECDCMDYMRTCKDKQFDLAIVDPPYGAGDVAAFTPRAKGSNKNKIHKETKWNTVPTQEYFDELFRVSKNQIIWGANYLCDKLPTSRGWIFWDKIYENTFNFSAGELAWTSFDSVLKMFRCSARWTPNEPLFIHPTQKPVALYKWLLSHYAHPGDKLLDTHSGSGSFRIAAYDMGFDLVSCEIDADYCRDNEARYQAHIAQKELIPVQEIQQLTFGER